MSVYVCVCVCVYVCVCAVLLLEGARDIKKRETKMKASRLLKAGFARAALLSLSTL